MGDWAYFFAEEKEKLEHFWRRKKYCGIGERTDIEGSIRGSHRPKTYVDPFLEHVHFGGIYWGRGT